jgi:hypothetical protein
MATKKHLSVEQEECTEHSPSLAHICSKTWPTIITAWLRVLSPRHRAQAAQPSCVTSDPQASALGPPHATPAAQRAGDNEMRVTRPAAAPAVASSGGSFTHNAHSFARQGDFQELRQHHGGMVEESSPRPVNPMAKRYGSSDDLLHLGRSPDARVQYLLGSSPLRDSALAPASVAVPGSPHASSPGLYSSGASPSMHVAAWIPDNVSSAGMRTWPPAGDGSLPASFGSPGNAHNGQLQAKGATATHAWPASSR